MLSFSFLFLICRYDVRHRLEDKSEFGLKPNLPRPVSVEMMKLEEELDKERYLALEWDAIRVEEQEGTIIRIGCFAVYLILTLFRGGKTKT